MNTQNIKKLIEGIEEQYDYIIIDTPPAYFISDAATLSSCADGVILVIKQDNAKVDVIVQTINGLREAGANIIGSVLNDIRFRYKSTGSKYNYMKKRYNVYGYGEKTTKKMDPVLKRKQYISYIPLFAWIAGVVVFALQPGATLISLSLQFSKFVVDTTVKLGFVSNLTSTVSDNYAAITPYTLLINDIATAMQDIIHVILFFGLSLLSLNALKYKQFKLYVMYLITFAICVALSLGNELYQQFIVQARGLEGKDLFHGMVGMLLGFICFGLYKLISNANSKNFLVMVGETKAST